MSNCPSVFPTTTTFVLDTPDKQLAANTIFTQVTDYNAAQAAAGSNRMYTFKTDWERMQAKIGQFGLNSTVGDFGLRKKGTK